MSSLWEVTEVEEVKITRKLLDSYKKLKRELPVLEYELNELWMTDKGMGNSVILNGKSGSKKPETVVGFDCEKYNRRKKTLAKKKKQVAVIEKWIDDIPDGQTRCVFKMFYRDISVRLMRLTGMMTAAALILEADPEEVIPVRPQVICLKRFRSKAP